MMKKRSFVAAVTALMLAVLALLPSSGGFAQINDARYDSYKNMTQVSDGHARYIVPNLYRQDASYKNVKQFPLVINGGTAYVPVDIFAMFSYIEIVNSTLVYGFYINNTKNNHYIAFNLEANTSATHANAQSDILPKMFNRTYYLPAKAVCETLGMKFEMYDNPETGIVAARISDDKAKYSFNELIKAYSPSKLEPSQVPEPVIPDNSGSHTTPSGGTPETQVPDTGNIKTDSGNVPGSEEQQPSTTTTPEKTEAPDPADPYSFISQRNIYLVFENCTNTAATEDILDVLRKYHIRAVFFVSEKQILASPDTLRSIIADGHKVGIYISPSAENGEPVTAENALQLIESANSALYLISKSKTRLVKVSDASYSTLKEACFDMYAEKHGYTLYGAITDSGDSKGKKTEDVFANLEEKVIKSEPRRAKTVYLRFGTYGITPKVLDRFLGFCDDYPRFTVKSFDSRTAIPKF